MLRTVGLWGTLAFVLIAAACKQAPSEEPSLDSRVHLYLTDFPINDVDVKRVLVTFTHIDVYSAERQQWLTVVDYGSPGRQFDLLTLQHGRTEELGAFDLEPGTYDQIRLHLTPDHFIEVDDGSGPKIHPLKIPSGDQTGIKIVRSFTVTRQGPTELTVDFDAQRSIHHTRGQGYILRPTIKLISISTPDSFAKLIRAATGGEVHLVGKAELKIPPNALTQDTLIEIRELELPESYTAKVGLLPSSIIQLGPSGLAFQTPAELRIFFDPEEIPAGQAPQDLAILSKNDGQAWAQHISTVTEATNVTSANIEHFTEWGVGTDADRVCQIDPDTNIEHCEPTALAFNCQDVLFRSATVYDSSDTRIYLRHITWSSSAAGVAVAQPRGVGCGRFDNNESTCDAQLGCGYDGSTGRCILDPGQVVITRPGCGTVTMTLAVPLSGATALPFSVKTLDPYRFVLDRIDVHDDCDNLGSGEIYWRLVMGNDTAVFDHPSDISAGSDSTIFRGDVIAKEICSRPPFIIGGFLADEDGGATVGDDVSSFNFGFHQPGLGSGRTGGCPDGTFHWSIQACPR